MQSQPIDDMQTGESVARAVAENLLKREELAARLAMSPRGVAELTRRRVIPVIRIGRRCVRYDFAKVQAAIARFEVPAVAAGA